MASSEPPPTGDDPFSTINSTDNITLCMNRLDLPLLDETPEHIRLLNLYGATTLIVLCAASVVNNACVLLSTCWIKRRPLSTTMRISLSLTGADTIASFFLGVSWFINNILRNIVPPDPATLKPIWYKDACWGLHPESLMCVQLALEALRLGSVLVTMLHLLALAANHYLGALRPLQSHVRHSYLCIGLAVIWFAPVASLFAYFSSFDNDGFRKPGTCGYDFLVKFDFHVTFSLIFFFVLFLMIGIYVHIYVIVQRHERNRQRFRRTGSSHQRGKHDMNGATHNSQYKMASLRVSVKRSSPRAAESQAAPGSGQSGGWGPPEAAQDTGLLRTTRSRRGGSPQFRRNKKAIVTTLFILGSYLVGWMPAVISFILVCDDRCLIPRGSLNRNSSVTFFAFWSVNFCIVFKTLANSFIYTSRMKEIKDARRSMCTALCRRCCRFLPNSDPVRGALFGGPPTETSHHRLSVYSRSSTRRALGVRAGGLPGPPGPPGAPGPGLNGARHEDHTDV